MSNDSSVKGKPFSPAKRFAGFMLIALVAIKGNWTLFTIKKSLDSLALKPIAWQKGDGST